MLTPYLKVIGAADTKELKVWLSGPLHQPVVKQLTLDTDEELKENGLYSLSFKVKGFPDIGALLEVDLTAKEPVKLKGRLPSAIIFDRSRFLDTLSKAQSHPVFLFRCTFGHPRELVFAIARAYTNEEPYERKGTKFNLFAETRRDDLTSKVYSSIRPLADNSTIVTFFDFLDGRRTSYMLGSPTRWVEIQHHDYGVPKPHFLTKDLPTGLSVSDIYKWIIEAGKACPGRVVQYTVFSHGARVGPVLVNTYDEKPDDEKRDPCDMDPRVKDFNGKNVDIKAFSKAFSKDAECYCLGCYVPPIFRFAARVLGKRYNTATRYTFVDKKKAKHRHTWTEWAVLVREYLNTSYTQALAEATGRPCWGAPPGAGAHYAHEITRHGAAGNEGRDRIRHWFRVDRDFFSQEVDDVINTFKLKFNPQWYVLYQKGGTKTRVRGEGVPSVASLSWKQKNTRCSHRSNILTGRTVWFDDGQEVSVEIKNQKSGEVLLTKTAPVTRNSFGIELMDIARHRSGEVALVASSGDVATAESIEYNFYPDAVDIEPRYRGGRGKIEGKRSYSLSASDYNLTLRQHFHYVKAWHAQVVLLGDSVDKDTGGAFSIAFGDDTQKGYRWFKPGFFSKYKYWDGEGWTAFPDDFVFDNSNVNTVAFYRKGAEYICSTDNSLKWPEKFSDWKSDSPEAKSTIKEWKAQIEKIWSKRFRLRGAHCRSKDPHCCSYLIDVKTEFIEKRDFDEKQTGYILVVEGPARANMDIWPLKDFASRAESGITQSTAAHEFGHHIGNPDEYEDASFIDTKVNTDGAKDGIDASSIMGEESKVKRRHFKYVASEASSLLWKAGSADKRGRTMSFYVIKP
jgi:hypothetical protein